MNNISLHGLETGVFDHGDEFLFGHFYLAVLYCVAFGEFAAFGHAYVEVVGAVVTGNYRLTPPELQRNRFSTWEAVYLSQIRLGLPGEIRSLPE